MESSPRESAGPSLDTPAAAVAGPAKMPSLAVSTVSASPHGASSLPGSPFMEEFQGNRLRLPSSGYSW